MLPGGHIFLLLLTLSAICLALVRRTRGSFTVASLLVSIVILQACFLIAISGRHAIVIYNGQDIGDAPLLYQSGAFTAARVAGSCVPHILLGTCALILLGNLNAKKKTQQQHPYDS